jgi:copper transport protein
VALGDVLDDRFGIAAAVRLLALAAIITAAGWADRPSFVPLAVLGAVAAVMSFVVTGHSATTDPRWLVLLADTVHVGAAAAWFGGLALLALALRPSAPAHEADPVALSVGRFSTVASVSLLAVAVSGTAMAWAQVRSIEALTSTTYGFVLLTKLVLVALVVLVAFQNNRVLVPRVREAVAAGGGAATEALGRLRRTVGLEVAGLVVILAATAVLADTVPARVEAGEAGPYAATEVISDELVLDIVVEPNRPGTNQVHLYLTHRTGRATDLAERMELRYRHAERDVGPIERTPVRAGPGHFIHAGNELALGGSWEIEVTVFLPQLERREATFTVQVGR